MIGTPPHSSANLQIKIIIPIIITKSKDSESQNALYSLILKIANCLYLSNALQQIS